MKVIMMISWLDVAVQMLLHPQSMESVLSIIMKEIISLIA
jgi:hypothetical protein